MMASPTGRPCRTKVSDAYAEPGAANTRRYPGCPLVFEWHLHRFANDVDAGDVQTDRLRGGDRAGGEFLASSSVTSVAEPPVDRLALFRSTTRSP